MGSVPTIDLTPWFAGTAQGRASGCGPDGLGTAVGRLLPRHRPRGEPYRPGGRPDGRPSVLRTSDGRQERLRRDGRWPWLAAAGGRGQRPCRRHRDPAGHEGVVLRRGPGEDREQRDRRFLVFRERPGRGGSRSRGGGFRIPGPDAGAGRDPAGDRGVRAVPATGFLHGQDEALHPHHEHQLVSAGDRFRRAGARAVPDRPAHGFRHLHDP